MNNWGTMRVQISISQAGSVMVENYKTHLRGVRCSACDNYILLFFPDGSYDVAACSLCGEPVFKVQSENKKRKVHFLQ